MEQNASTVDLKNSTVQSNVPSSNDWNNLDQLQNQYRQNRNARRLATLPASMVLSKSNTSRPIRSIVPSEPISTLVPENKKVNAVNNNDDLEGMDQMLEENARMNAEAKQLKNKKFKNALNQRLKELDSNRMERVAQMERNVELWKQSREVNPRKIKANDVLAQIVKHSRKPKVKQIATNSFTPSKAYLIAGHGTGGDGEDKFKVPPGCTIVVGRHPYETAYAYIFENQVSALITLPEEVITNPVKHSYDIIKAVGSVAIFQEGDECPNFHYTNTLCFPSDNPTMCYGRFGSGINNLITMKEQLSDPYSLHTYKGIELDYLDLSSENLKGLDTDGVVDLISYLYRFSVSPTQDQVSNWVKHWFRYRNSSLPIPKITSLLRDINKVDITQKVLCKNFPGVYYNFVCRTTEGTNTINRFNTKLKTSQRINNTIKRNTANLLTARILETELQRKQHIKNFYKNPNYIKPQTNLEIFNELYRKFVEEITDILTTERIKYFNENVVKIYRILDSKYLSRTREIFDPIEFKLYQKKKVSLHDIFDNFIKRYEERYPEIVSSINASTQGGRRTRNNRSRRSRRARRTRCTRKR